MGKSIKTINLLNKNYPLKGKHCDSRLSEIKLKLKFETGRNDLYVVEKRIY